MNKKINKNKNNITDQDYMVMKYINDTQKISQRELSKSLNISLGKVNYILKRVKTSTKIILILSIIIGVVLHAYSNGSQSQILLPNQQQSVNLFESSLKALNLNFYRVFVFHSCFICNFRIHRHDRSICNKMLAWSRI